MLEGERDASPSVAVLDAVAEAKGVEPVELDPPLHTVIDADSLDRLFEKPGGTPGRVVFHYSGCEVTVESHGEVTVRELTRESETAESRAPPTDSTRHSVGR